MVYLEFDNHLKGDFGELVFEHFSKKNGYAYIKLEDIYKTLTPNNVLTFRQGWMRRKIKLPDDMIEEVRMICKPSNDNDGSPSFVFDYLTIGLPKAYFDDKGNQIKEFTRFAFHWVEIKTNKSVLTPNQETTIKKIKTPFYVFRVLFALPNNIDVRIDGVKKAIRD